MADCSTLYGTTTSAEILYGAGAGGSTLYGTSTSYIVTVATVTNAARRRAIQFPYLPQVTAPVSTDSFAPTTLPAQQYRNGKKFDPLKQVQYRGGLIESAGLNDTCGWWRIASSRLNNRVATSCSNSYNWHNDGYFPHRNVIRQCSSDGYGLCDLKFPHFDLLPCRPNYSNIHNPINDAIHLAKHDSNSHHSEPDNYYTPNHSTGNYYSPTTDYYSTRPYYYYYYSTSSPDDDPNTPGHNADGSAILVTDANGSTRISYIPLITSSQAPGTKTVSSSSGGLSKGAIGGIAGAGALLVIILAGLVAILVLRRRRQDREHEEGLAGVSEFGSPTLGSSEIDPSMRERESSAGTSGVNSGMSSLRPVSGSVSGGYSEYSREFGDPYMYSALSPSPFGDPVMNSNDSREDHRPQSPAASSIASPSLSHGFSSMDPRRQGMDYRYSVQSGASSASNQHVTTPTRNFSTQANNGSFAEETGGENIITDMKPLALEVPGAQPSEQKLNSAAAVRKASQLSSTAQGHRDIQDHHPVNNITEEAPECQPQPPEVVVKAKSLVFAKWWKAFALTSRGRGDKRDSLGPGWEEEDITRTPAWSFADLPHSAQTLFTVLSGEPVPPEVEPPHRRLHAIRSRTSSMAFRPTTSQIAPPRLTKAKGKQTATVISKNSLKKLKRDLLRQNKAVKIVKCCKEVEGPTSGAHKTCAYALPPLEVDFENGTAKPQSQDSDTPAFTLISLPTSTGGVAGFAGAKAGAFDIAGQATGAILAPLHQMDIDVPVDRLSVFTWWWGYELALPPPVLETLRSAHSISSTLFSFLQAFVVAGGAPELAPFVKYLSSYVDMEYSAISSQNKGKGVVLSATWLLPVALVPRPWDFPPPRSKNKLKLSDLSKPVDLPALPALPTAPVENPAEVHDDSEEE
ncbi:hypothetical protein T439DRAFT_352839 [Meredithblackwellia eburnea MCA 4105]